MVFQTVLLFVDASWYRQGMLLDDPVHIGLLLTHLALWAVWLVYAVATFRPRFLPRIHLTDSQLIWTIYIGYVLTNLPRAVFAHANRSTLIFYSVYLFIALLFFLVNHRVRIAATLLALLVMLPAIWLSYPHDPALRNVQLIEVLLVAAGMFTFSTQAYNAFVTDFRQRQIIEKQNAKLQQQAGQLAADKQHTEAALEQQTQALLSYILQEQQRNSFLIDLREQIVQQPEKPNRITQLIDSQLDQEDRWGHFTLLFERLHPHFFANMQVAYPHLNTHDLRMMALLRLNLSTKEIANLLGISPQSANTARYRLRKRLNLNASEALEAFLQQQ